MGAISLFVVLCAVLLPSSLQQNGLRGAGSKFFHEEDNVIVLNKVNFEELTKNNPVMLVEFFAPWCGHCRHFAPTYAAVAKKLKTTRPAVPCGKVDVTAERKLADEHRIRSFPTVKLLIDGEDHDEVFDGSRTEDAVVKFALDHAGPAAANLLSFADLQNLTSSQSVAVVGFFKRHHKVWTDEIGLTFSRISRKVEQVNFAYSFEPAVWERYNLSSPAIIAFPLDGPPVIYGGSVTIESEVEAFAKAAKMPAVVSLRAAGLRDVLQDSRPLLLLFHESGPEGRLVEEAFNVAVQSSARRLLGVVVGDQTDRHAAWLRKAVELQDDDRLAVCILQDAEVEGGKLVYKLEGEISKESIIGFIKAYFAHELHPLPQAMGHRDET